MKNKQQLSCVIHDLSFEIPLPIEADLDCPMCMYDKLSKAKAVIDGLKHRQKVLLEAIDIKINTEV